MGKNVNKRMFVKFDDDFNVVCLCDVDSKECDSGSGCREYHVKFTDIVNTRERKISKSPRKHGDSRTLTGELDPSKVREHTKQKINNLLKKD